MDKTRNQLKTMDRQFNFYMDHKTAMKNNLIPLLATMATRNGWTSSIPADDAVYAFMDKKRAHGKPYYDYMTAGANKFLRIYYGRVKEYLSSLAKAEET